MTFERLCEELSARGMSHRIVDTADRRHWPLVPRLLRRAMEWMVIAARYLFLVIRRRTTVYLVITQSRAGFVRDALVIGVAALLGHRIILHANCGNYGGFHAAQPRLMQRLISRVLCAAETIVIPSARMVSMFDFEPRLGARLCVVPNAAQTCVEPSFRGKELPRAEIRLVFLSNFIVSKGYHEVIRTVSVLRSQYALPVVCELVGDFLGGGAAERAKLQRAIAEARLDAWVTVRPPADAQHKAALLRGSHFLLLPTRYDIEAQPLAIIEAMAAGCVPIAPRYRAIPDLIVDGETGLLVEPRAEEMARAIAELSADPQRYTTMSRAAAAHQRRHFTAEEHLQRMRRLLAPEAAMAGATAPAQHA